MRRGGRLCLPKWPGGARVQVARRGYVRLTGGPPATAQVRGGIPQYPGAWGGVTGAQEQVRKPSTGRPRRARRRWTITAGRNGPHGGGAGENDGQANPCRSRHRCSRAPTWTGPSWTNVLDRQADWYIATENHEAMRDRLAKECGHADNIPPLPEAARQPSLGKHQAAAAAGRLGHLGAQKSCPTAIRGGRRAENGPRAHPVRTWRTPRTEASAPGRAHDSDSCMRPRARRGPIGTRRKPRVAFAGAMQARCPCTRTHASSMQSGSTESKRGAAARAACFTRNGRTVKDDASCPTSFQTTGAPGSGGSWRRTGPERRAGPDGPSRRTRWRGRAWGSSRRRSAPRWRGLQVLMDRQITKQGAPMLSVGGCFNCKVKPTSHAVLHSTARPDWQ